MKNHFIQLHFHHISTNCCHLFESEQKKTYGLLPNTTQPRLLVVGWFWYKWKYIEGFCCYIFSILFPLKLNVSECKRENSELNQPSGLEGFLSHFL